MALDSFRICRVGDHSFLEAPLSHTSVVVDLGLNRGEFALAMIQRFGCRVIGLEPVAKLFNALPQRADLTVHPLAITSGGARSNLYLNEASDAATVERRLNGSPTATVTVDGITLRKLFDRHELERVALVKVDIEGAEFDMFRETASETLARVDQFTIEFHDFLDPSLADGVHEAKRILRAAGFAHLQMSADNTDVLFVNLARIEFDLVRRSAAKLAYKYPRGVRRKLRRRLAGQLANH